MKPYFDLFESIKFTLERMMKTLLLLLLLTIFTCNIEASSSFKYKRGDCITPINKAYSWYGKYATVEAVSKLDGFAGVNYILLFNNYLSNSAIFSLAIETDTRRVDSAFCE